MSFDQYFENNERAKMDDASSNDWYSIVEEALSAAEARTHQHKTYLEANLMKPLPMIPEDVVEEPQVVRNGHRHARRTSSVYSWELDFANWPSPYGNQARLPYGACLATDKPNCSNDCAVIRRPSSVYDDDLDSPDSPESFALNCWGMDVRSVQGHAMSSLQRRPFDRQSSNTFSTGSSLSTSVGSSDRTRGSMSSSPRSSADASYAKSFCMHQRNESDGSDGSSRRVRLDDTAVMSFFDFSDDEESSTEDESGDSGGARSRSSKSIYLKASRQLRKKAMSLRIATNKPSQSQEKTLSMPGRETPGLSAWLFRSSLLDRASTSSMSECTGLEGQLMAGAAEKAKARRVLGLK